MNAETGLAMFSLKSDRGTLCRGESVVVNKQPPLMFGIGERGFVRLRCSDGRLIMLDWENSGAGKGSGMGIALDGGTFALAYGGSDEEMRAELGLGSGSGSGAGMQGGPAGAGGKRSVTVSTGTGFFVSADGIVVTNAHVVEGRNSFTVVNTITQERYPADLLQADGPNDIAILKVRGAVRTKPLPVAAKFSAKRGEEVLTLGYPLIPLQGNAQKATFGRVNSLTGLHDDIRFAQVDLPIQPGNSGGPLLNRRGEVIGLTSSSINQARVQKEYGASVQNVNYAVKVDYLHPMLHVVAPGVRPGTGVPGLSMEQLVARCEESVVQIISEIRAEAAK